MPRVLLVDTQPVLRKGLIATLEEGIPGCRFGQAGTGSEAISLLDKEKWDLAIVQIAMPDMSWMDLIRDMRLKSPQTRLLVFCRFPEEHYGTRCIKLGAAGYLSKNVGSDKVLDAVRQVLSTGAYISPAVGRQLAQEARSHVSDEPHESLSDREFEVFRMLASGITVKEIADRLSLSVKTVSTYRKRVLEKMGMHNNADLLNYAASIGLLN